MQFFWFYFFLVATRPDMLKGATENSTALNSGIQINTEQKIKRALGTRLHPEMLGRAFEVLALAKDLDIAAPLLAGFKFARQPDQSR